MNRGLPRQLKNIGFIRYFKNTSWLMLSQALRMTVGISVMAAVARHLGTEAFGQYNFILSIVAIAEVITFMGLQNLSKREFILHSDRKNDLLGTCFILSAFGALSSYLIVLIFFRFFDGGADQLMAFTLAGATLLLNPFRFIDFWFLSQIQSKYVAITSIAALLITAGFKIMAILKNMPLETFFILFLLEAILLTLFRVAVYRKTNGSLFKWQFSKSRSKELLAEAWPLLLAGFSTIIYMRTDIIMLKVMQTESAVGIYAAATKISSVWYFIPTLLASSLFPAIVNSRKLGVDHYQLRIQRYFNLNALLAYMIILPLTLSSSWIIELLYGSEYYESVAVLRIHAWAILFVFIGVARTQYLINEGYHKFSLFATSLGAACNIGMNVLLIPSRGPTGAAMATLISFLLSAYISSFLWKKTRPIFVKQTKALFPVTAFTTNHIHEKV